MTSGGEEEERSLLAVDLGVKTGLALYGTDGRLRWYGSRNFGNRNRLRRGIQSILESEPDLEWLVVEGGGDLARLWIGEAEKRRIGIIQITAEVWREKLILPRDRRSGADAKRNALAAARRVIEWSQARRPTSLRHDAAEAVMIGLWGALETGMLNRPPPGIGVGPGTRAGDRGKWDPPAKDPGRTAQVAGSTQGNSRTGRGRG